MNKLLDLVLRVLFRLSLTIESEDEYFSLQYYSKLIYDHWIFDMAKLIDIPAIYGKSNPKTVQTLLTNVFDNEKKFVQDFKETFDLLVGLMKTRFKEYSKVKAMIMGEYIEKISHAEQEKMIAKYL
jgi:hypothetical protein